MIITAISPAINRIRFRFFLSSVPFLSSNLFIRSFLSSALVLPMIKSYTQSFLQTGSYVLYFIIWTCGEIVKQKKYSSFVKSKCKVWKNDYKSESQVADDDKIVTFTN